MPNKYATDSTQLLIRLPEEMKRKEITMSIYGFVHSISSKGARVVGNLGKGDSLNIYT